MESVGGWEAASIIRCRILKIECEPFKSVFPSLSRHDPTQENDSVCVAQRVIGDGNSELQATLHIAWHPLFPTREEKSALNHYKKKKKKWRRKWQPTPVFLAGKFHGQRSLAG